MTGREISEEEFDREFIPQNSPTGEAVWWFEEVEDMPLHNVWSIIDGDDDRQYALPGFHVVNVFGYTVTERPWTDDIIAAVWTEFDRG